MKPCLPIIALLFTATTFAQPKEEYYAFDSAWKAADVTVATFLIVLTHNADSNWQWEYYNFSGPLLKVLNTTARDGEVLNGPVYYYSPEGALDSMGQYSHGRREGDFYRLLFLKGKIHWATRYTYANDSVVKVTDLFRDKDEIAIKDSLQKAGFQFPGVPSDSTGTAKKDTSLKEVESVYPGGIPKWSRYLSKNLKYPDRAVRLGKSGTAYAAFSVDENGVIGNYYLAKSIEFSIDREVSRVIHASGKWVPGTRGALPVKTYKLQPINLRLE